MYHISKRGTSVLFKIQKRGDVKVSNVTCGYALSSAAVTILLSKPFSENNA